MNLPKILIAAPTSDKKDYCFDEWADNVLSFTYPNSTILLVDNSHNEEYYYKILDKGISCLHVKPEGNAVNYITDCQNIIRHYAIEGGYDYLFSLESDVIPRSDIIIQLLHHRKRVVSAPYFVKYKGGDPSICMTDPLVQHFGKYSYMHTQMVGTQKGMSRLTGELIKVFGCGIGCSLIHVDVLRQIEFRSEIGSNERRMDRSVFSDSLFYLDCAKAKIPVYLETSMLVTHKYSGWDANEDLYIN